MSQNIRQLDKDISNKIAAGEVVERPLAVVKELVENAIDAGSTKITVEIKGSGKTLIRITDNGSGIVPEELPLAFERHATSKIRTINDIYNISSLGFRGEALASIASVSIVEIISKHENFDEGKKLVMESGHIVEEAFIGAPQGTTIFVKDLFYNTPARLKFLKSNNAEQNAINDIMNKLALSHPEVAFKYIVNGQNIFMTPGNNKLYDVILNIYQRQMAKNLLDVDFNDNSVTIKGFISNIEMTRGNRQQQVVFVNNRYVKSKVVEDAVGLAYRTKIPHNRFPIVFLNIIIDPSLVDINIHPAKTEIRFHQEGLIKDLIYKCVSQTLNTFNLVPKKDLSVSYPSGSKHIENREVLKHYDEVKKDSSPILDEPNRIKETVKPKFNQYKKDEPSRASINVMNTSLKALKDTTEVEDISIRHVDQSITSHYSLKKEVLIDKSQDDLNEALNKPLKKASVQPLVRETLFEEAIYEPSKPLFENKSATIYDDLTYIGQIFSTYLIFEKQSEMYLLDQHAAHEKVLFEQYVNDFKTSSIPSQMILEPITIPVNYMEQNQILANIEDIRKLGFYMESFGESTMIVREIPQLFSIKTAKEMIIDLIEKLDFSLPKEQFELKLESLMQQSCKAAIKANDVLDTIEVNSLIKQLKTLEDPYTCPHGRPIIISMSKHDLEKKFNRT